MRWKKRAGRSFGIILAFALAAAVGVPMLAWADEGSTTYVARIGNEEYPTLIDAAAAANAGDTVELLVEHTSDMVTFNVPVTLDLGGNTLTIDGTSGNTDGLLFLGSGENALKNGSVIDIRGQKYSNAIEWLAVFSSANLSTENVVIEGHRSASSTVTNYLIMQDNYNGSGDTVLNLGSGTVLKDADASSSSMKNDVVGVALYGTSTDAANITRTTSLRVADSVTIETSGFAIAGHGNSHGTEIAINRGTIISTGTTAIYHPQYGTMDVTGGTIAGTTGIEMRAGTLNVTGGTIKGAAEELSVESNPSGETTVGAGIAIAQHTTKLPLNVSIAGGTISGAAGLCESNPQENSPEDIAKVTLSVKGGTFTSSAADGDAIISDDKTAFITGGTFSSDPEKTYFATGYTSKPSAEGYSGYETVLVEGYHDVADFKDDKGSTYPEAPTGQAFAGWYTDETCAAPYGETTGAAYAKFVDASDIIRFKGGSLRMDTDAAEKTNLRFGYSVTMPEGLSFDSAEWAVSGIKADGSEWSANQPALYWVANDLGTVDMNLLLINLVPGQYANDWSCAMTVKYKTADGTMATAVEPTVQNRSVQQVAQSIVDRSGIASEKKYAQAILDAIES